MAKMHSTEQDGQTVQSYYDRPSGSWVAYAVDADGEQVGDSFTDSVHEQAVRAAFLHLEVEAEEADETDADAIARVNAALTDSYQNDPSINGEYEDNPAADPEVTARNKARLAKAASEPGAVTVVERAPCLCGCGGFPKGRKSRFVPGHDARYHGALKRAARAVADDRIKAAIEGSTTQAEELDAVERAVAAAGGAETPEGQAILEQAAARSKALRRKSIRKEDDEQ